MAIVKKPYKANGSLLDDFSFLVFCQFRHEVALIHMGLTSAGYTDIRVLDGKVPMKKRNLIVQESQSRIDSIHQEDMTKCLVFQRLFQKKGEHASRCIRHIQSYISSRRKSILIMNIKVGNVGLNLQKFQHMFITSPHWNPTVSYQAMSRVWRLGQLKPVHVYRLLVTDEKNRKKTITIDTHMKNKQIYKCNMIRDVLNDDSFITTLYPNINK